MFTSNEGKLIVALLLSETNFPSIINLQNTSLLSARIFILSCSSVLAEPAFLLTKLNKISLLSTPL
jgi:hypothetical protein